MRTVLALVLVAFAAAQDLPFLHPLFADHCVLQRQRPIPVWGWTTPGATVTVTLAGIATEAKAGDDGTWMARLPALEAGGPHELTVAGPSSVTLTDVLIGEVWLCSGQSNMEQGVAIARNPEEEFAAADHPRLRLCWVRHNTKGLPQAVAEMSWAVCTPENLRAQGGWGGFSAAGYFFGRKLLTDLDVPIGLIHSSWGGTPIQTWISPEGLAPVGDFAGQVAQLAAHMSSTDGSTYEQRLATWWSEHDDGSKAGWEKADAADGDWAALEVPGLWEGRGLPDLDGVVWFRRTVEIPAEWAGKDLTLSLGAIDDQDTTWFDGTQVGATNQWNRARNYPVGKRLVTAGTHTLAIRVLDTGGGGGFSGQNDQLWLALSDAKEQKLSLAGAWKHQVTITDPAALRDVPTRMEDNPHFPTILSNGMIEPLVPVALAGAVWYQGESNAGNAPQYRRLLPALIADWRRRFENPELFVGVVQLASFKDQVTDPVQEGWAALRESQAQTVASDAKTSLAVAIDIGEAKDIHPKNKQDVGLRLALGALAGHYGKDLVAHGPEYRSLTVADGTLRVTFAHAEGLATADGEAPKAFAIRIKGGPWVAATAVIDGETVLLSAEGLIEPDAVRYAWADNPAVNLVNGAGLPAVPFRSDVPE